MANTEFPITDISNLLPHRAPLVMVHTLLDFSNDKVVSGFKISESNILVENGVLLETGIIENMAQTVALHTGYDYYLKGEAAPTGYIGSIKKVDIFQRPKCKEVLRTEVTILHEFMGVTLVDVEVFNEDKELVASGQMKTVIAG